MAIVRKFVAAAVVAGTLALLPALADQANAAPVSSKIVKVTPAGQGDWPFAR